VLLGAMLCSMSLLCPGHMEGPRGTLACRNWVFVYSLSHFTVRYGGRQNAWISSSSILGISSLVRTVVLAKVTQVGSFFAMLLAVLLSNKPKGTGSVTCWCTHISSSLAGGSIHWHGLDGSGPPTRLPYGGCDELFPFVSWCMVRIWLCALFYVPIGSCVFWWLL